MDMRAAPVSHDEVTEHSEFPSSTGASLIGSLLAGSHMWTLEEKHCPQTHREVMVEDPCLELSLTLPWAPHPLANFNLDLFLAVNHN